MWYEIKWKHNGQIHSEYGDEERKAYILDFLKRNSNAGFTLISVAEAEED